MQSLRSVRSRTMLLNHRVSRRRVGMLAVFVTVAATVSAPVGPAVGLSDVGEQGKASAQPARLFQEPDGAPAPDAEPVDVGQRVVTPDDDLSVAEAGGAFYVQFSTRLTDAEIEELEAAGSTFGQSLGGSTYIVRLDRGASSALAAHPFFVGLTPVAGSDKSAAELIETPGEGAVAQTRQATIEFFPDVTIAEALAAADAAGIHVLDRSALLAGSRLAVFGTPAQLRALAEFSGVLFVGDGPGETETHNLVAQQLSNVDDVQATGLTGAGVTVGIWDGGPTMPTHGDFGSRVAAHDFQADLTGAAEVPGPGDPNGTGFANISLQGTTLVWNARVKDIAAPTATHIHTGGAGQSGAVFLSIPATYFLASGTYFAGGSIAITSAQASALRANPHLFYVNIHNAAYPNGAVRGQFASSDSHATHVGGTMIGSGAGNASAEGMAPGVPVLQSYDFLGDRISEMTYAATTQGVVIANHSYGRTVGRCSTGWCGASTSPASTGEGNFGLYDSAARDFDNQVLATGLIHVKSSGNDRNECGPRPEDVDNCDGVLAGDGNYYDNISTYGNAKNVITVGAVNDDTTLASFSSTGPSNDGRIKPDVVANGVGLLSPWNGHNDPANCAGDAYCSISGTSMSSPTVTGIVALLEQRFRQIYGGADIPADAAKAVLANTATDLGRPGPDYFYGYGLVDAQAAVDQLALGKVQFGTIASSSSNDALSERDLDTYTINVGAGTTDLRVSVNWLDLAGLPQADVSNTNPTTPAIVNQLDITLRSPNGTTYYPFEGPGRSNPTGNATAVGPNHIDTLQQVRVANPEAGNWTVVIRGYNTGDQDYALATSEVACQDDDYEDLAGNDEPFFAAAISEGQTVAGEICDSDVDYFKFPIVAGDEIFVEALFAHAAGDLDLRLYDPTGTQVDISDGSVDNETITYTALLTGDYQVSINGFLGAENSYDLVFWTGVCGRDDALEDNDDQASATSLSYGSSASALICGTDADWFTVPVTAGDEIFAQALFSHPVGNNINMALFDPAGNEVASANSTNNNETVLHTATTTGDYAVRVYGFAGAETFYDLTVWNGICTPDDAFEDNNTQATAAALVDGENTSAILCDGDLDWFTISAAPGDLINVEALFDHSRGDLDIALFDPTETEVELSGSASDNETLSHLASLAGDYAIRINGFGSAENVYDVTATAQPFTCGTGPWSAPTAGLLNVAIDCFNSQPVTGVYTINVTADITMTSASTPINNNIGVVTGSLQINGMGHTVDAAGNGRVFSVNTDEVEFVNITITGGNASFPDDKGGGIYNFGGNVTVTDSTITDNTAATGGGIFTDQGTTTVTNSTISDNSASSGGGILLFQGTTTVTGSTISGNDASSVGGGILNSVGTTTVTGSTISGNTADADGGGIYNGATVTVSNSTISGNTSGDDGGGIANYSRVSLWWSTVTGNNAPDGSGVWTLEGGSRFANVGASVIADNNGLGGDVDCHLGSCTSTGFGSEGFNVIGNGNATPSFAATQDTTIGTGAGLGPLQNNGGATETHLPDPTSPVVDRFNITTGLPSWDQALDQRSVTRPTGVKDAGAVEVDCGTSPWQAPDTALFNLAIGCFNAQTIAGEYTIDVTSDISLTSALAQINNTSTGVSLTIFGNGFTVDGAGSYRVFDIAGSEVGFEMITISGGNAVGSAGGGIQVVGGATVTVTDSTISGNVAGFDGGGISITGGMLSVTNSTISGNSATFKGGGVFNNTGSVDIVFSTVTGNMANTGTGVWSIGSVNSPVAVSASIVADNSGDDLHYAFGNGVNPFISNGYNVIGAGNATSVFIHPQDTVIGVGAGLGPLQDNGGTTETHLPIAASPAIDRFNITVGLPAWDQGVDQRGVSRPQGPFKDSGSVEVAAAATCNGLQATIVWGPGAAATNGPDVIVGTAGDDVINGLAGDDTICGLGGADIINGGGGSDTIFGGDGDDVIGGQGEADFLHGEGDNDRINGGVGEDQMWGGDGDDDLRGQGDADIMNGGEGIDQFFGGSGNDVIDTGEGGNRGTAQVVRGGGNNDTITGSSENDDLEGGSGLDDLYGLGGDDRLRGGNASDDLFGGPGVDLLEGGAQRDFLYGGDDDDDLRGGTGNDDLFGESGDDSLNGQGDNDLCDGGTTGETAGDAATVTCETQVDVP